MDTVYIWIVVGALLSTMTTTFISLYNKYKNNWFILLVFICQVILTRIYFIIFQNKDVIIYNTMLKIGSVIWSVIIGMLVLNIHLSASQIVGILFTMVGLYLL